MMLCTMSGITPGIDGERLPVGTRVFRIGKIKMSALDFHSGQASPGFFTLSSKDEESAGKRLSLWVEENTLADEAWTIMGEIPSNTMAVCFGVDDVHAIIPPEDFHHLEVQWEKAMRELEGGSLVVETREGAIGHCGIAGLIQGVRKPNKSRKQKDLRDSLASISRISPVPVPHDIPSNELQAVAAIIAEQLGITDTSQLAIMATRQIRRRVREHYASLTTP